MMMASFMDLHGIQNMCLHCCIIHKNTCGYTIHSGKKSWSTWYQGQYFESRTCLSSSKTVSFGLLGLEGEFQGLVKESRYSPLKNQKDKKTGRVSTLFPLSASHSIFSVKFLLTRSNCSKKIRKSENLFFSKRVSVYDWPLGVNKRAMKVYSRFAFSNVRHL